MNYIKPYREDNLQVTSEFGYRATLGDFHNGIDISGVGVGNPTFKVLAAEDGVVIGIATNGIDHGGNLVWDAPANWVKIQHANGDITMYWHLSKVWVAVGQRVTKGQEIGRAGRTGAATGYHLHFCVYRNGQFINPRDVINFNISYNKPMNKNFITVQAGWGLSHVAQAAGYSDFAQASAWERIYNLNKGFRGANNWQELNARMGAGDNLRVREDSAPTPQPVDNKKLKELETQLAEKNTKVAELTKQVEEIEKQRESALEEKEIEISKLKLQKEAQLLAKQQEVIQLQEEIDYINERALMLPKVPEALQKTNQDFQDNSELVENAFKDSVNDLLDTIEGKKSIKDTVIEAWKAFRWIIISYTVTILINYLQLATVPLEYVGIVNMVVYSLKLTNDQIKARGGLK